MKGENNVNCIGVLRQDRKKQGNGMAKERESVWTCGAMGVKEDGKGGKTKYI